MDSAERRENQRQGKSEFYESTRMVLLLFKCMGLLPIRVTRGKSKMTRLIWSSMSVMPYVILMTLHMLFLCIHAYNSVIVDFDFKKISGAFIDLICILDMFLLLLFVKSYDKLMRRVGSIENSLPPFRRPGHVTKVSRTIMALVIFFTLLELILQMIFSIGIVNDCFSLLSEPFIETYFTRIYPWCFNVLPFTYGTAVLLKLCRLQITFTWHSVDMLILIISYHLVVRLHDFNHAMFSSQKLTIKHDLPWLELQVHYTRLMRLVKIIDKNISGFILASLTLNLICIGQQIYVILNKVRRYSVVKGDECVIMVQSDDWKKIVFIFYSMVYLVVRTVSLASIAACIHTKSREPLNALYTVPASFYNDDLQTFMDQVYHSKVGLSGLGFFYISREMILTVIATLTTYELVLLQF